MMIEKNKQLLKNFDLNNFLFLKTELKVKKKEDYYYLRLEPKNEININLSKEFKEKCEMNHYVLGD